jgi:hypothetical protein
MNAPQDYYTILGVDKDAAPEEIKAAFKKLALKYHPDVYKGDDAHERMRLLLLAYKTLNDPLGRKEYDLQLYRQRGGPRRAQVESAPRRDQHVTPGARRDRQRHYAFPAFAVVDRPVLIDLVDFSYSLSPREMRMLEKLGVLRGVAPETSKKAYFCHRCHYHWYEAPAHGEAARWDVPRLCPQCHAWDWPEYLLLHCVHCGAVFESEQIRYEVGSHNYGKKGNIDMVALCPPYELFPLCPYCGAAHWCPAEEKRAHELRQRAAYRETLMRLIMIGVVLALLVAIGLVTLSSLH